MAEPSRTSAEDARGSRDAREQRDPLRRRVRARALAGLARAAGYVPPAALRAALWPAAAAARASRLERRALDNLRIAYGDALREDERRAIAAGARHHWRELATNWLRLARSEPPERGARGDWIEDRVAVRDDVERLDEQLARGRGAIVVTAHLGDWELLCARLRRRGYPGAVVGLMKRRDPTAEWLVGMRRAYGVTTLSQGSSPREMLRVLQGGGTLGLVCDLEVRRLAGEFLPFFGTPALTMTAPAALARAAGVPLIPARCVRPRGERRYVLSVDEPLHLDAALERREAGRDLMTRVNARFEAWIRETPEQWAWHQARWRTRPGDLDATPLHGRAPHGRTPHGRTPHDGDSTRSVDEVDPRA